VGIESVSIVQRIWDYGNVFRDDGVSYTPRLGVTSFYQCRQ